MKKKTLKAVSMLLAMALCFSCMGAFAASAAEAPKPKTNAERIAALKETYGVTINTTENLIPGGELSATELPPVLAVIEAGLSYLGSGFVKKVVSENGGGLRISVAKLGDMLGRHTANIGTGQVDGIFIRSDATASAVVHELGHAFDFLQGGYTEYKEVPWSNVSYKNTGNRTGLTAKGSFISEYAKTSALENYAESFMYGVINGPDKPYEGVKDGQVYKCLKAVFDDLVSFAGYGSRATQRMAGYLGIDISDKLNKK